VEDKKKDDVPELLPGMPEDYYDSPMAKYMNSSIHSTPEDKEDSAGEGEKDDPTPLP
jgi:hypothetical protein